MAFPDHQPGRSPFRRIERRFYAQGQEGFIRAVSYRQAAYSRFTSELSIIGQYLVGCKVPRVMGTIDKITIDDGFYALEQAVLPQLVEHAVQSVRIFANVLEDQNGTVSF